eukprot:CAMPEP_0206287272 /NCGR_PEP_ID=MMETSP0106_2-20121207/1023_1 /ASSEMBLY_ACC=CAM_ASM_000206 /TAXON_ID=81532 /ORGANISM="Acanthoeca-like sp., Strain 10tr" /LENGTH=161 /DNA_ID=CAMNT_0053717805 /DNA_START=142 /DNA_END=627 /DNA_ORIENTATION=+
MPSGRVAKRGQVSLERHGRTYVPPQATAGVYGLFHFADISGKHEARQPQVLHQCLIPCLPQVLLEGLLNDPIEGPSGQQGNGRVSEVEQLGPQVSHASGHRMAPSLERLEITFLESVCCRHKGPNTDPADVVDWDALALHSLNDANVREPLCAATPENEAN